MPDCEYFEELCSISLDGVLTRAQKRELDTHLAECPACAAYYEDLKFMRTAWGDIKAPLDDALHEKIMSGVIKEAEEKAAPIKEKRKRRPPVFTMIGVAAACVVLALSGAVGDIIGGLKMENSHPAAAAGSADDADAAMESTPNAVTFGLPEEAPGLKTRIVSGDGVPENAEQDPGLNEMEDAESGAGVPAAFAQEKNAAADWAVTLPDDLLTSSYGFCYVAVGRGAPPALTDANLIEKDGGTYYFRILNSMTSLDGLRTQLRDADYETALRSDVGITTDESAKYSLLIVAVKE